VSAAVLWSWLVDFSKIDKEVAVIKSAEDYLWGQVSIPTSADQRVAVTASVLPLRGRRFSLSATGIATEIARDFCGCFYKKRDFQKLKGIWGYGRIPEKQMPTLFETAPS